MDPTADKAPIVHADEAGFESEVLRSKLPVLAAFWAPWSHPCQVLDSVLDEVAAAGAASLKIVKVNADDNPDLSLWYEIQSIPTLLVFVDGLVRAKVVGTASKDAILSRVQSVLQHGAPPVSPADAGASDEQHTR